MPPSESISMMGRVCVATSRARAYYSLVSRLRKAGIPFVSLVPGDGHPECDLVLTTAAEAGSYGARALTVEALDENPFVFKGQILSRLTGGNEMVLIGVDPGARIGMAVYYGDTNLAFGTYGSIEGLCSKAAAFVRGVPSRGSMVRVGNGNPALAVKLAEALAKEVPQAVIEVVDESGTSARSVKMKGLQGDQSAAARIAFRKGAAFSR